MKGLKGLILLFVVILAYACQDSPQGESDDPIEISSIDFDHLYAIQSEIKGSRIPVKAEGWNCNVFQHEDLLTFQLEVPDGFEKPMDPDLPDSTPGRVSKIKLELSVQTNTGEILFEKNITEDIKDQPVFQYSLPVLSLNKLKAGKHNLKVNCRFNLVGENGTLVFGASSIQFNWLRKVPPVYKTTIRFKEFRLSDERHEKSKSNNDGLGNPLPDLFWTFSVDGVNRFKSSTYENSNPYLIEKMNFNIYHLESDPLVGIEIYDDDYTSGNDLLAKWSGKLSGLIDSDFKSVDMAGVDHFKIFSDQPKICNP